VPPVCYGIAERKDWSFYPRMWLMLSGQAIPLLFTLLVVLLLGLVGWGFVRSTRQGIVDAPMETRGDVLLGLLLLAALALGVFLTYILMVPGR